ncbi:DUF3841 domain-containing protein [Ruminococcaceae bacterium OttesenSCG-928-I18]|nr:DUF3841 domain-containing protein [Ruminococcaceae bacterium OttesenSCG-928-I18]
METVTLWTKQHRGVLNEIELEGRYIARRENIVKKMEDISRFYLEAYSWYAKKASEIVAKPPDVNYPIWVSLDRASSLENDADTVVLCLEVESTQVVRLDYEKWGYVINFLYVPKDEKDEKEHQKMLSAYGTDDVEAYFSAFYPAIKKKIIASWGRMFEIEDGKIEQEKVGTLWEIRKEWIRQVSL